MFVRCNQRAILNDCMIYRFFEIFWGQVIEADLDHVVAVDAQGQFYHAVFEAFNDEPRTLFIQRNDII